MDRIASHFRRKNALDDADHDLFRKVCHSHHSLNHLLPPKRIFTNLRARAGHPLQLPEYTTLLHRVIHCESLI